MHRRTHVRAHMCAQIHRRSLKWQKSGKSDTERIKIDIKARKGKKQGMWRGKGKEGMKSLSEKEKEKRSICGSL